MKIHKEGFASIVIAFFVCAILTATLILIIPEQTIFHFFAYVLFLDLFFIVVFFFRIPKRTFLLNENHVLAPADGTIVAIEEIDEQEYFNEKRIQVSIFMSPLNVHVNRYPVDGVVKKVNYESGKYLVAFHPKSSTHNERTSVVIETPLRHQILVRQIAGMLARRIVCYSNENAEIKQGDELGFIKFGSRVDLMLPLSFKIAVSLNQKVQGGITTIASIQ